MAKVCDKPSTQSTHWGHVPGAVPLPDDGRRRLEFEARYRELCELWPKERVELVDSRIVVSEMPTIDHNQIVFRLLRLLMAVVDERGWEIWNDITLFLGSQRDRYRPDLTVVPPNPRTWGCDHIHGDQALLVVEVVSASSANDDHSVKPGNCAAAGVPLYLVVDAFDGTARLLSKPDRDKEIYTQGTEVALGTPLELPDPWNLTLDTAKLVDVVRPAQGGDDE